MLPCAPAHSSRPLPLPFSSRSPSGVGPPSFTGKVTKMNADSFEAGALGLCTTFKIDKRPYDEGGKKMMVVDGTPLTRVE